MRSSQSNGSTLSTASDSLSPTAATMYATGVSTTSIRQPRIASQRPSSGEVRWMRWSFTTAMSVATTTWPSSASA